MQRKDLDLLECDAAQTRYPEKSSSCSYCELFMLFNDIYMKKKHKCKMNI